MDFEKLYEEKCQQYIKLEDEFNQFLGDSQTLEDQQQERIQQLEKLLAQAQNRKLQLQEEVQKCKKELQHLQNKSEKQLNQKDTQITELQKNAQTLKIRVVDLEVDQDQNKNQIRQLEEANKELEIKLDRVLEQLALAHTDLEANKSSASEEVERLKQSLKDNQDELTAAKCSKITVATTPEFVRMPKIDSLRANAAGFNKSLTLISALIKDLDEKMTLIRHQKA